jgi:hypothetical protein
VVKLKKKGHLTDTKAEYTYHSKGVYIGSGFYLSPAPTTK